MIVNDIYEDARSITGLTDQSLNFNRISDAVEVLNNKGNFDALLNYVIIKTTGTLVTLPRDVETPLRINIDDRPAFARDRLYEFSQNGPGSDSPLADWQWADHGTVPTIATMDPSLANEIMFHSPAADSGKIVYIDCDRLNSAQNIRKILPYTLGISAPIGFVSKIYSIRKPVTTGFIDISLTNGTLLSRYDPEETFPDYRQIRLSKPASSVYILYRRSFFRISSLSDVLPIRSKMGLLYMIKALQAYRHENYDGGKLLEEQAIKLTKEEHQYHNTFIEISAGTEIQTARNLNYNHIDTIIVADIIDDAAKVFGPVGEGKLFDKISEARRVLANKAQWDSLRGFVDINTDQYDYVTLPRYVEYPIKINLNGSPAEMKNKWFEFNSGGPGESWLPCDSWKDLGEVVTARDVPYTIKLKAIPDRPADDGKKILVQGYYKGKRVFTTDINNKQVDGAIIIIDSTEIIESEILFDRIERIVKDRTEGYVRLVAEDTTGEQSFDVGYYYPDELEPRYRRIQLPHGCERVRVMYRLREGNIRSLTDPIHLKSKTALITMMMALKALEAGDVKGAAAMEIKATEYLREENSINNQSQVMNVDFGKTFTVADQFVWA